MSTPSLLWFRRDLRLSDHAALLAAAHDGDADREMLGVFVADDALMKPSGAPRRHFLAGCLSALDESMGGRLLIVHGRPETVIPRLAAQIGADSVHISADFMPYGRRRDDAVAKALQDKGIELVTTGSPYAIAPGRVTKDDGSSFAVFTPFYRAWKQHGWRKPAVSGKGVSWIDPDSVTGITRHDPDLLARPLPKGMTLIEPGEKAGLAHWKDFLDGPVDDYQDHRDRPDLPGTSRMSAYLKWGCLHPRTLLADLDGRSGEGAETYRSELAWREFYADVVHRVPESTRTSLDPVIEAMEWDSGAEADEHLQAWKDGRTGVPFVDAGMRQLLAEGWIHNRLRMVVASYLIKDLHLPWQIGARHFMEHLVDGDLSSNNHGWQWVAGSGSASAAFYRVFNPMTQGEKFDPNGEYVRKYVPELAGVSGKAVHQPWLLPDGVPDGYPEPIVDHKAEREEALRRFKERPKR
ncbi:deoxyribodipyrimidine photo-lyase [Nakamurella flavida]|uniref:Deoxyribodipyrimidine photo-lyase n=1 Tax=Nakamurella flavida TaxID=363630 RepID=A0A938YJ07_9ACTN|nr:deoxyribodipyrimidine photo-lyase [Nakamurella flavida]MBM9475638.1 deoxyribodipyrimidine photo-lyase [Nakamurella flavida]MDP9778086.1 deoxyribodipyrimidine photo-lyase [Nakamurella flavida]